MYASCLAFAGGDRADHHLHLPGPVSADAGNKQFLKEVTYMKKGFTLLEMVVVVMIIAIMRM